MNYKLVPEVGGVYSIVNKLTNNIYIGSSNNCKRRLYEHKSSLKRGIHYCKNLQADWIKYNENDFEFTILLCVLDNSKLFHYEQIFVNEYINILYNSSDNVFSPNKGKKYSEEVIEKIRIARKKQVILPESHAKRVKTVLEKNPNHFSDIAKIGVEKRRLLGIKINRNFDSCKTPEFRQKISLIQRELAKKRGRKFICNETKEIFSNTGECARIMNLPSYKVIWKCLNNKVKSYLGFTFSYL